MTTRKRILMIDNSTGWTGAFKSIVTVAQHLSRVSDFHFCIPSSSSNRQFLDDRKIPYRELNFIEISKRLTALLYPFQLVLNAVRIKRYCKQSGIDIVHVNDIYNLTGIVVKLLRPKTKLIYHIRLLESSYARAFYKTWIRLIARFADNLVTVSQAAKADAVKYTQKSIRVIHDCIDGLPLQNKRADTSSVMFLYLANYTPGKGHDVAIKSFAHAYRQNSTIKMIMAGGDLGVTANKIYKRSLSEHIANEGLSDVIEMRGFEPDIHKIMSECDVFLNFSASESFSMTCLEAIMNGKPVIATASGGPAEIVKHDYCGLIIPVGDVRAAADAMLQLAGDAYKRDYFCKNAIRQAEENFNLEIEAAKLSAIYNA